MNLMLLLTYILLKLFNILYEFDSVTIWLYFSRFIDGGSGKTRLRWIEMIA